MIDTSAEIHLQLSLLTSKICVAARLALEGIDKCSWEPDMNGACSFASSSLVRLLRRRGIPSLLVIGTYDLAPHCWAEVWDQCDGSASDSRIQLLVDITATQFEKSQIYVTTPGEDRKYAEESRGRNAQLEVSGWVWGNEHRNRVSQTCRRAEKLLLSAPFQETS